VSWDAYQEFTRIRLAKGGSIARLSTLAQANPQNARVISYFARVAESYQDFATAALRFSAAADVATESESKLFLMRDSALNYLRADDPKSAANVVERMKGIAKDDDIAEVALHRSILEVFQHEKKVNLILGVQERLVQLEPEDIETRYSLAHRYAESGNHGLSLMHYLRIPSSERTAGAWNNIGVAFAHCSFPIKSTDAYRTAEKMGATLAMSNLANNMLNAGFLAEAKAICIRAQTIPDHDKNVDVALARTFDEVAEEDKTLDENLKESAPQSTYYSAFGHALSRPAITSIKRFWKHPKCRLEVTISGDQFIAIGSYKEPVTHGLLGLTMIGPLGGFATAPNESDVSVEYRGTINGHAVEGSASRKKSGQLAYSSLATSGMEGETTLLVINEQQTEIWIMEMSISKTPTFLKIFVETPE
jgi:sulfur relay (sulfurtransferase) complex TusBCD TusD component (DsrE family)